MESKLNIFLWNVGCRKGEIKIPAKLIYNKLDVYKSQVIVFTEISQDSENYIELKKEIENRGYNIFLSSYKKGKNQVLIAIQEDYINGDEFVYEIKTCNYQKKVAANAKKEEVDELKCQKITYIPDFLCIEFEFQGKKIAVIGCRMQTGDKDLRRNYDDEAVQFYDVLLPELEKVERRKPDYLILCGDLNNAKCCGKINRRFKKEDYRNLAQINYNLNRIKDKFDDRGFVMLDIKDDKPIETFKGNGNYKNGIPDDHIFVKGSIDERKFRHSCECGEFKLVKPLDHVYLSADIIF